jgi:hypothetical protein
MSAAPRDCDPAVLRRLALNLPILGTTVIGTGFQMRNTSVMIAERQGGGGGASNRL